jgi:hypothetical protein
MFLLSSQIAIGEFMFDFVTNVNIKQSLKEFTGTCTITIPKRINARKKANFPFIPIQQQIKPGDLVYVWLGYDGRLRLEFKGYVKQVNPKVPLEIECEDEMYVLKRTKVAPKKVSGKLSDLIKYIAPNHYKDAVIFDTELGGSFLVGMDDSDNAVKVLEKVEEVYGLKSSFTLINGAPILCVGTQYVARATSKPVKYILTQNVIENDLQFVRAEDLKISIEAKSRQSTGKVLTAKFKGDKDGDTRSFACPGLSQEQLEKTAKELYKKAKTSKYDGTITTFGIPFLVAGMRAELEALEYEITKTTNYVDEVEINFGTDGFRRIGTIGPKAE